VARAAGRGHGLLAEADNVDILATDAVYGVQPGSQRGSVIAHTDGDPDSAAYSYYFRDRLGTPQVIRDGSKVLTGRQQTSPYGVPMVSAGIPVVVGYTGHKWDEELDSFYAPYRYYNPWTARWKTRDPAGPVEGFNQYLYARNSPAQRTDHLGLRSSKCQDRGDDPCKSKDPDCCIECCLKKQKDQTEACWKKDAWIWGKLACIANARNCGTDCVQACSVDPEMTGAEAASLSDGCNSNGEDPPPPPDDDNGEGDNDGSTGCNS
jgi:RHS repeat-associated protein